MPSAADTTNITPPRVPLVDPASGMINREWYRFFVNLFRLTGSGQTNITLQDLQIGPDSDATSVAAVLQSEIQNLSVAPTNTPQLIRHRYGAFYDTTTQTAAAINTAYPITFNATDFAQGVTRGSPTSRIFVDTTNVYNIQFSAQLLNTSGGGGGGGGSAHRVWIWLRKNGVDVPDSATTIRIQGNNTEDVAAWNFLLEMNQGDYFELMWAVDNTAVRLEAFAAAAFHPSVPSVILTVSNNISSEGNY
jgi:hypothetical protein